MGRNVNIVVTALQHCAFRCARLLVLLMIVLCPSMSIQAGQSHELDRNHVIAQMILNFPLVTTWPASHAAIDEKIQICALSENPVGRDVMAMVSASKAAAQYRFSQNVKDDEVGSCHLLIVTEQDAEHWQNLQTKLKRLPILTVGTSKNFLRKGGIIGFVVAEKNLGVFSEQTVRFDIHMMHARMAGLVLDPMLLELAEHIITE
jgi:hypothetical protein